MSEPDTQPQPVRAAAALAASAAREREGRRRFLAGGAGLALLAGLPLLGACASETPLTVAFLPWPGYAPLHLADRLGAWRRAGIAALRTGSASESLAALREGRAAAAALTLDELLRARTGGLRLRAVALLDLSRGADMLLARPDFADPARWPGARLGREEGAVGALMAASWMRQAGLARDRVRLVAVAAEGHEAAWNAGEVDLLVTYEPIASRLLDAGAVRVFDSRQLPPDRPIADVLAVQEHALDRASGHIEALVRSVFLAQRHLKWLPADSAYRMAPWLGLSPAEVMRAFAGLRLTGWRDNRVWLGGDAARLPDAARGLAAFLAENGLLAAAVTTEDLSTADFLPPEDPA